MRFILIGMLVGLSTLTLAQHSPYAGEENRPIKALSEQEIDGYLNGAGMGFAKVAELNHYPGPRHVLDLAGKLHLTEEQIQKGRAIFDAMKAEAISLGKRIVEEERLLDSLFAEQRVTREQLEDATNRIAVLQGKLRATHLRAHLLMKEVLTPEQIQLYDELRGYTTSRTTRINKQEHHP
jgi:Spy/CpxP family protein refolding chaperone